MANTDQKQPKDSPLFLVRLLADRDIIDAAGEDPCAPVIRIADQLQNPHARIVVVQNFALRCLPD